MTGAPSSPDRLRTGFVVIAAVLLLVLAAGTTIQNRQQQGEQDTRSHQQLLRGGLSDRAQNWLRSLYTQRKESYGISLNDKSSQREAQLWGHFALVGPPNISRTEGKECDTEGGCRVDLYGSDLANDGPANRKKRFDWQEEHMKIFVGQFEATQLTWKSETWLRMYAPKGVGKGLDITVKFDNQPFASSVTVPNAYSYKAPIISRLDPATGNVNQTDRFAIKGRDFGYFDSGVEILVAGKPCGDIKWRNDRTLYCTPPAFGEAGLVSLQVTVAGQVGHAKFPIKDLPEPPGSWNFDIKAYGTKEWGITVAAINDRTGYPQSWFDSNKDVILSDKGGDFDHLTKEEELGPEEAVAVQMFRRYMTHHFAARKNGKAVQDLDGVYVKGQGNHLNGDKVHDQEVIEKQVQVLEEDTGERRSDLAKLAGKVVDEVAPCPDYPDCQEAQSTGHRGWTWHWHYSNSRGWKWMYAPISEGDHPPSSCSYCDPVKVHKVHGLNYTKTRMATCMFCVAESFKNLDEDSCLDFKDMCLQCHETSGIPVAGSCEDIDPPPRLVAVKAGEGKTGSIPLAQPPLEDEIHSGEASGNRSVGNMSAGSNSSTSSETGGNSTGSSVPVSNTTGTPDSKDKVSVNASTGVSNRTKTPGLNKTAEDARAEAAERGQGNFSGAPDGVRHRRNSTVSHRNGSRVDAREQSPSNGSETRKIDNSSAEAIRSHRIGGVRRGRSGDSMHDIGRRIANWTWVHEIEPMEVMEDRHAEAAQPKLAEYSPEQFVDVAQYPDSRIPESVGPAGSHIRDATVLISASVVLLGAVFGTLSVFVYQRAWFVNIGASAPNPGGPAYQRLPSNEGQTLTRPAGLILSV